MLSPEEIALARQGMEYALNAGAQKVRITLSKSLMELTGLRNGAVEKVTHALDRSFQAALFVDGRFGTFSSNRLEKQALEAFLAEAVRTTRMMAPDPSRDLPGRDRIARDAPEGNELGLYDPSVEALTPEKRRELALRSMAWPRRAALEKGFRLASEEGEYSDSVSDTLVLDSEGLYARALETSFEIGYEVTLEDPEGQRFSGYWWDARPRLEDLLPSLDSCAETAIRRAAAQMDPQEVPGGKYSLVVENECASRLLTPVLNALGGYAIQQKNSFLTDRLGQAVFSPRMNLRDEARTPGGNGARLFDSEGVATREGDIIREGVVSTYFVSTYIANKTGLQPTVDDASRPRLLPTGGCRNLQEVLRKTGTGILVTGFNGGNHNASTGDFSFGIEGFYFRDGQLLHPVREMLITGNLITLWNHLELVADDARPCMAKLVPTLAFSQVDCSA